MYIFPFLVTSLRLMTDFAPTYSTFLVTEAVIFLKHFFSFPPKLSFGTTKGCSHLQDFQIQVTGSHEDITIYYHSTLSRSDLWPASQKQKLDVCQYLGILLT